MSSGLSAESDIEDDTLSDDLSDGEDAPDRKSVLRSAVLGMTQSDRSLNVLMGACFLQEYIVCAAWLFTLLASK